MPMTPSSFIEYLRFRFYTDQYRSIERAQIHDIDLSFLLQCPGDETQVAIGP